MIMHAANSYTHARSSVDFTHTQHQPYFAQKHLDVLCETLLFLCQAGD